MHWYGMVCPVGASPPDIHTIPVHSAFIHSFLAIPNDVIDFLGPTGSISTVFVDFLKNLYFDTSLEPYIGQKMVIFDQKWPFLAKMVDFGSKTTQKVAKSVHFGPITPLNHPWGDSQRFWATCTIFFGLFCGFFSLFFRKTPSKMVKSP